jgi:hypothetical protein
MTTIDAAAEQPAMTNMFQECESVTELIYQLVGAGSTCWVDGLGDNEFDTDAAKTAADDAINRLIELGWAPDKPPEHIIRNFLYWLGERRLIETQLMPSGETRFGKLLRTSKQITDAYLTRHDG